MHTKTKNIDLLNVALIFISLMVAYKVPFELFLFSYAVLGPLHYLTEINWLKEKNYFVKEKSWTWVFVVCAALVAIPAILKMPVFNSIQHKPYIKAYIDAGRFLSNEAILISLIFAIGLVYLKKTQHIVLFLLATIAVSSLIIMYVPVSVILVGVFVPTIIHVYLFTMLFMIFGTMNNRSTAGVVAIVFLMLVPFIIVMSNVDVNNYILSEKIKKLFSESGFQGLSRQIANVTGGVENGQFYLLSEAGIKIQIFIAFCYTYHYLNWFSKTSVIGWGKNLNSKKLVTIIVIWALAVFLYWYDYKTGFVALLFLSFFHVLLEFPLNVTSIKSIAGKLVTKPSVEAVTVNVQTSKKKGK